MNLRHYKKLVETAFEILKERGEVTVGELAYLLDVNPGYAREILKTLSYLNDRVEYSRGRAVWLGEVKKDERGEERTD